MKDNLYNVLKSNKILKRPKALLQMVPNNEEPQKKFYELDVLTRQKKWSQERDQKLQSA
jgi:hypothetical protein